MNWHMIISGLVVVVLKVVGATLFLLYFPQIFGQSNDSLRPTGSYGTVPQIFGNSSVGFIPTESSGTASWNKSRDLCQAEGSTLAIVNTPEKLKFLQDITGAEKYFIGLLYQPAEKRWRWIDNSIFNGNVSHRLSDFNCATIGLTMKLDAASCDTTHRWICEKRAT